MTDTTYVDQVGPAVNAAWLNDVNIAIYQALGAAGVAPTTAATVIANLHLYVTNALNTMTREGDQAVISSDLSKFRVGTAGGILSGSLFTLLGTQAMMYASHNVPITVTGTVGTIGVADETAISILLVFDENSILKIFYAPSVTAGQQVVFNITPVFSLDCSTGTIAGSSSIDNHICDFRLTLQSGIPVAISDTAAGQTVYFTPYKGNRIALYTGTSWVIRTSAEILINIGTVTANLPYDVFCYDNAGTPTLEILAWTNSNTRATALALQDGVWCKTGALTRRFVGTFYTISTVATMDTVGSRYLWNMYNRVPRKLQCADPAVSWTYTTGAFRQVNANTANQLNMVRGLDEDAVSVVGLNSANNTSAGVIVSGGLGVDSTTVNSAFGAGIHTPGANYTVNPPVVWCGYPGVGRHFLAWLEYSGATGTTTWTGNSQAGLQTTVMA